MFSKVNNKIIDAIGRLDWKSLSRILQRCPQETNALLQAPVKNWRRISTSFDLVKTVDRAYRGLRPIHLAAAVDEDGDIVRGLLSLGADINSLNYWEETPLHIAAILNPRPNIIAIFLERGAILSQDEEGCTPFHLAAGNATDVRTVKAFLDAGVDVHLKNRNGTTPLHWAVLSRSPIEIIKILVENGADVQAEELFGFTPLHLAAKFNSDVNVIKLLLESGGHINGRSHRGVTPLMMALSNPNRDVFHFLHNNGADLDATDDCGLLLLHRAVCFPNFEQIDELFGHGAGLDEIRESVQGDVEFVRHLLHQGLDVDAKDQDGTTPLYFAASRNIDPAVVQLLVDYGADVHATTSRGYTPLIAAIQHNPNYEVFRELLDSGAEVNVKTDQENTPLHFAAANKSVTHVDALLEKGADVNALNDSKQTPLMSALYQAYCDEKSCDIPDSCEVIQYRSHTIGYLESLLRYLHNGSTPVKNIFASKNDETIREVDEHAFGFFQPGLYLIYSSERRLLGYGFREAESPGGASGMTIHSSRPSYRVVRALMNRGADVKRVDFRGQTALHIALDAYHFMDDQSIRCLIEYGADVNAISSEEDQRRTPLHIATGCDAANSKPRRPEPGVMRSIKYLVQCGADVNARDAKGRTPLVALRLSANNLHPDIVRYLVGRGADIHARDEWGNTILHRMASEENRVSILNFLVSRGADVHAINNQGLRPVDKASPKAKIVLERLANRRY